MLIHWSTVSFGQDLEILSFQNIPDRDDFGLVSVHLPPTWEDSWEIHNLKPDKYAGFLTVHVGDTVRSGYPPVDGKYSKTANGMLFKPRFPPVPGAEYTILFSVGELAKTLKMPMEYNNHILKRVMIPKTATPRNAVVNISPGTSGIPANIIRFYVHFKNPMGNQNPYEFLRLFSKEKLEIQDPFVEIPEGLWDAEKRRLTVLIHPGRVKRGVGPNMTMGPVFERGSTYKLVILPHWKDANGNPLGTTYEHTFIVDAPIRNKVAPEKWMLDTPSSGDVGPLRIHFEVMMDHALSTRMIQVMDSLKKPVRGDWNAMASALKIRFIPHQPWAIGNYYLQIDPLLEDVAGNNLIGVFDHAVIDEKDLEEVKPKTWIPFKVGQN